LDKQEIPTNTQISVALLMSQSFFKYYAQDQIVLI